MAITYPGTLDTFVNPTGTSTLDSPDHALQHSNVNDAIEAVQAVVGTTAGTAALMDFAAGDFALERSGGTATNLSLAGTPVLDATSAIPFYKDSIYRQAIINGNFDVWQRGTSLAMTTADAYAADRWYCETATAATDKTVSRQTASNNGSYYSARVAMVQDTDELLTFSQALESQDSIKFRGQKLTLSFWAKAGAEFVTDNSTLVCKIVTGKGTDQKVLAFTTSADAISANKTLTDTFVKHTITTTAAIASDITQIGVSFAFTHAGAGVTTNYFEVSQVQLCAGSVALPFQPKSYAQELADCQRYYQKIGAASTIHTNTPGITWDTAGVINALVRTTVDMRATPTIPTYPTRAVAMKSTGSATNVTTISSTPNTIALADGGIDVGWTGLDTTDLPVYTSVGLWGNWIFDAEL